MAAFRLIDQARTFFGQQGQLLPGGSLLFTVAGTTTPVNVYGNRALSVNNGSTVALDSSGRATLDVWGDTAVLYRMRVYDVASVLQADVDNIEVPGGAGQTIPIPASGEFITGDGSNFLKATIRQVPDPAGNANKILGTDGTVWTWVAKPTDGTPGSAGTANIAVTSTSMKVGTMLTLYGNGTGTNVGGRTQTVAVTFAQTYDTAPVGIKAWVTSTSLSSAGNMPSWSLQSISTTGATIKLTMGELDDSRSMYDFNAAATIGYEVTGIKA